MEKSYNGWTASKTAKDFGGLDNRTVPGTNGVKLAPGVRAGDVATVLFYVAAQLHARVEKGELYAAGDEWGFSYRLNRNANNLSCHSSGTAFDWNATRHPNGKRGTFTKAQVTEIRKILAEVGGIVRWGGDFTGTPDEMHFEIVASPATVAMVADRLTRTGSPITTLPVQEDIDMSIGQDILSKLVGYGNRIEDIQAKVIGYGQRTENVEKMVATVADRQVGYGGRIEDTQARVAALQAVVAQGQRIPAEQLEAIVSAAIAKSVVKVDVSVGTAPLTITQVEQAVADQTF